MSSPPLSELLRAASRTFAVGIELLPETLRAQVEVAYLLLRVSDYLEDNEVLPAPEKARLLADWEGVLAGSEPPGPLADHLEGVRDGTPDALVARRMRDVLEGLERLPAEPRRVVTGYVRESTLGMARWVARGPRFDTEADLDDYMHEVAGRVGYLLTDLFALHSPTIARRRLALRERGREFGLALQTVNVVRGLCQDHRRGWIFVPRSFTEPLGLEPAQLFEEAGATARQAVLEALAAKADRHFASARGYVHLLPRREVGIRLFCVLPLLFGVRTLAISRHDPEVFRREAKISRAEVRRIVARARVLGCSNLWLEWYARRQADGRPPGQASQTPQRPTNSRR